MSETQAWNQITKFVSSGDVNDLGRVTRHGIKLHEFAIGNRVFEILDTGDAADGTGDI